MIQQIPMKTKTNKPMMLLSAFGILFVVDGHAGSGVGLFASIFPYGSFFMPLFMFVSGYFWKDSVCGSWGDTLRYLKGKFGKLMVPYFLWMGFYWLLVSALNGLGMAWNRPNLREFIYSVATDGTGIGLSGAAWFVPALFAVITVYTVLRRIGKRCWADSWALLLFALVGIATVWLAQQPFGIYHKALLLYKVGYFLFFFHLGYWFHHHWEGYFDKVNGLLMCILLALVNVLAMARHGAIDLGRLALMCDLPSGSPLLPMVVPITGIFFWLKLSKLLTPVLGENKVINYISSNTFFIMMHHLLFLQLFGGLLYLGNRLGIGVLSSFDAAAFRTDPWYLYIPGEWMKVCYFLFGITATLLACKGWEWLRAEAGKMKKRRA